MSKKWLILIVILLLILSGWYLFKKEIGSVSIPSKNVPEEIKQTNLKAEPLSYLNVPQGFAISVFAKDLPGARVIAFGNDGSQTLIVSQTSQGTITRVADKNNDGVAEEKKVLIKGLNNPHGLALTCGEEDGCYLYVAEADKLMRYQYDNSLDTLLNGKKVAQFDYNGTDRHSTRTLQLIDVGDRRMLLISIGSSCNVCQEKSDQKAKILLYDMTTEKLSEYASGLRNAVFMARSFVDGKIWATEMGRDGLGDNIPPDEINIIEKDKNYGWPICYGKNIHDTDFDKKVYVSETARFRQPCTEPFETPSTVDLQAHSAPLGLDFIPEEGWPKEYWYNLLVSYHGSWNRSVPTGYKIVRIKLDSKGNYLGTEDFITGWLDKNGKKNGRPVDIKIFPGGTAYISDDDAGVIYRLYRTKE